MHVALETGGEVEQNQLRGELLPSASMNGLILTCSSPLGRSLPPTVVCRTSATVREGIGQLLGDLRLQQAEVCQRHQDLEQGHLLLQGLAAP